MFSSKRSATAGRDKFILLFCSLFFFFFITSCTHLSKPSLLKSYVKEFKREFKRKPDSKVKVKYVTVRNIYVGAKHSGKCVRWFPGVNKVYITKLYWSYDQITDTKKWALVYHELAHCRYNLDHSSEWNNEKNCPASLMHPFYLTYERCFDEKTEKEYYIEELRERINSK